MAGWTNVNGAWRKSDSKYANVNGVWKKASCEYVNVNGVWKSSPFLPSSIPFAPKSQFTNDTNSDGSNQDTSYRRGYMYMNSSPWGTDSNWVECNCSGTYSRYSVSQNFRIHDNGYKIPLSAGDVFIIDVEIRCGSPRRGSYVEMTAYPDTGSSIRGSTIYMENNPAFTYRLQFTAPTDTLYRINMYSRHEDSETIEYYFHKVNINGTDIPFTFS